VRQVHFFYLIQSLLTLLSKKGQWIGLKVATRNSYLHSSISYKSFVLWRIVRLEIAKRPGTLWTSNQPITNMKCEGMGITCKLRTQKDLIRPTFVTCFEVTKLLLWIVTLFNKKYSQLTVKKKKKKNYTQQTDWSVLDGSSVRDMKEKTAQLCTAVSHCFCLFRVC